MGLYGKERDLSQAATEVVLAVDASAFGERHDEFEMRLDAFLAHHLSWRSRSSVQDLIRTGFVLVDASTPDKPRGTGTPVKETRPARRVRHGSTVVVVIPEPLRAQPTRADAGGVSVLHEDTAVLVVDKPPGMPVHPSGRYLSDTLIQRVHALYGAGYELEQGGAPRLCHRIDKDTSGVVVIGRHPEAHMEVRRQFEDREVEKEYLALVYGVPERDGGVIDYPIGPSKVSRIDLKMAVLVEGAPCRTEWRVVERARECALVACKPITGRQHQIRVHLSSIGHAIVGDKLYGPDEMLFEKALDGTLDERDMELLGLPRQALHAHRIVFKTPATNERLEVCAPLPRDMADYLDEHR